MAVAVPTFQGERFLESMLESVAGQSRPPDQIVISDDASTDRTREIALRFSRRVGFEVEVLGHLRSGITNNYLNAVRVAEADVIVIGDQDDIWHPDRLKILARWFAERPEVTMVSADSALVDENGGSLKRTLRGSLSRSNRLAKRVNEGDDLAEYLRGGLPLLAHTLSFRGSLKPVLLEKPIAIEDWWFEEWASCVAVCNGKLALAPEALTLYRQHGGQTTRAGSENRGAARKKVSKYAARIRKMRYCRDLVTEGSSSRNLGVEEQSRRAALIDGYIAFLTRRDALITRGAAFAIVEATGMLLSGAYSRYARGAWSWGLDVASVLRS